jgi:hypothetical protein
MTRKQPTQTVCTPPGRRGGRRRQGQVTSPVLLATLPIVLLVGLVLPGCNVARFGAYVFAPRDNEMIDAEYDDLAGQTVAVVAYVPRRVEFEYPTVRADIIYTVSAELRRRVDGAELIPPQDVVDWQDSQLHWADLDRAEIGRRLGAERLVFIALHEFSTREPASVNLFRGRATAEVSVYDAAGSGEQACVWRIDEPVRIVYPESGPVGRVGENDYDIRVATQALLTRDLVKPFYRHRNEEAQ